jgi:DNA-binding CsgD family transcriptional regulator
VTAREQLTPREVEILRLVAEGLSNSDVGRALKPPLSQDGVEEHLKNASRKLGARGRPGLVGAAYLRGWLTVEPSGAVPDGWDADLHETLVLVAQGKRDREIAEALFLSLHGAKCRVKRLRLVLGAGDRANLVHVGIARGVLRLVPRQRVSP